MNRGHVAIHRARNASCCRDTKSGLVSLTLTDAKGAVYSTIGDQAVSVSIGGGAYVGEGAGMYRVEYIPEPTTATLSLLALCGLAARRRG